MTPPSTDIESPVVNAESSEAKNKTADTTSSGCPILFIG